MARDISKLFGTPSTLERGIEQFYQLKTKLKNNDVWSFPSMHRGYLVLRHQIVPVYPTRPQGQKVEVWVNYLYKTKPTGRYLKIAKV